LPRCSLWRVSSYAVLGLSLGYATAVSTLPDHLALTLLRAWAAVSALVFGWTLFRILLLQCPRRRGFEELRRVAELPPG
jgi:sulfite exporter TauE/SafE